MSLNKPFIGIVYSVEDKLLEEVKERLQNLSKTWTANIGGFTFDEGDPYDEEIRENFNTK